MLRTTSRSIARSPATTETRVRELGDRGDRALDGDKTPLMDAEPREETVSNHSLVIVGFNCNIIVLVLPMWPPPPRGEGAMLEKEARGDGAIGGGASKDFPAAVVFWWSFSRGDKGVPVPNKTDLLGELSTATSNAG